MLRCSKNGDELSRCVGVGLGLTKRSGRVRGISDISIFDWLYIRKRPPAFPSIALFLLRSIPGAITSEDEVGVSLFELTGK